MDALVLLGIAGYQRHLSPRKGYRCAHSVLHGGDGCSGAIYRAVEEFGLRRAVPVARRRFRDCHLAAQILRAGSEGGSGGSGSGRPARKPGANAADCCDSNPCSVLDLVNCCPADAACAHAPAHAAPCDCAACDVGACDAGICDAGICDCHPFHCL